MAVQTMVRVYGQWTLEGQEEAAEALADLRGLRKAMPLLSLVPTLPLPVVMTTPANDDAVVQVASHDRRRVDVASSRISRSDASVPGRASGHLAIVA